MTFSIRLDLLLFLLLFGLFVYVFASVAITRLHKIYLLFHFLMMLWPLCQFIVKNTSDPDYQLFFVKAAFVDLSLIAIGWLVFTLFFTGRSAVLQRRNVQYLLALPALLVAVLVMINPNGLFVLPGSRGYIDRVYGPLFWLDITVLFGYQIVSLIIIYQTLVSDTAARIKKQVKRILAGISVLIAFTLIDILLNVVLVEKLGIVPGLTSIGILLATAIFVIAIHRDKVFDIVTIAHQDVIDTIELGILVVDDNHKVMEINKALLPHLNLRLGDHFDMEALLRRINNVPDAESFLRAYRGLSELPCEIEVEMRDGRHITLHAAPVMVGGMMVGRIITFQDVSVLRRLVNETYRQNQILQQMAVTDSLTGCFNRRYVTELLESGSEQHLKQRTPFAIALLDIDYFKTVNDRYGHLTGDEVIRSTVAAIRRMLRSDDVLARFGGEEFMIYFPGTDAAQAGILAEQVKEAVERNEVNDGAQSVYVTISLGLLTVEPKSAAGLGNPPQHELDRWFRTVDEALYQAKRDGRNRVVTRVG